jgi:hypothetical protein
MGREERWFILKAMIVMFAVLLPFGLILQAMIFGNSLSDMFPWLREPNFGLWVLELLIR